MDELYYPWGIAADSVGNIYVVDDSNHRVEKFAQEGTTWCSIVVSSTPQGAGIFLDGVDQGHITPYTLTNIAPGEHTIAVNKTRYLAHYPAGNRCLWADQQCNVNPYSSVTSRNDQLTDRP